ncbi:ligase-associated DNA damage response DEXH box helicase [Hyphomicrobium methylovorum]|uniref:ligase-associated DNA damage response DEXH box helicase n=1 Tax=Hyphomicrobium methylovorum TaxID=84 RepID=UPI0015E6376C|nr:ligase-associated DNA damage response DEXH box helicase [Hyphomicrobium methylovorum]MBA2125523.1 ligase-associated DNA damage response DEXH box helicase [Hyphomicrobium methylovorum]
MPVTKSKPRSAKPGRQPSVGSAPALPQEISAWFKRRGWTPRPHQLALLDAANRRASTLLIAPTGAGKTLAGFLPSLVSLQAKGKKKVGAGLFTLYVSPLKALAADVERNLIQPISEMGLSIRTETRTGDTSAARRQRQRVKPPQILLTTPEQIALLLSHPDAPYLFADLDTVILDELHALAPSKRGDLLALDLTRLRTLAPNMRTVGLSATVARPSELRGYLVGQTEPDRVTLLSELVTVEGGAKPEITILESEDEIPWSGHTARYAMHEVYEAIRAHKLTLVFVNARLQAEVAFQELWRINDDNLPIGLHHGSLEAPQRKKVEAAMASGKLKAVVATSTLDLGIDWGDVDLVIHLGAPKGASRFLQRIGRANHRMDEPSRGLLVPGNRFEVLECRAAQQAAEVGAQDAVLSRSGGLDVLAQHILGMACQAPFRPDDLFTEVRSALAYAGLSREQFDRAVAFVSTGGYALRTYERFAKLKTTEDGKLRVAHPRFAQQYRLNVGTIVDSPMLKVRLVSARRAKSRTHIGGKVLGEVDEYFAEQLPRGATFVFAGQILRFEGMRDTEVFVSRTTAEDPMVPSYGGNKFPLSTHLAARVRAMLADPAAWPGLPPAVSHWLELQKDRSVLPAADEVLIETFPRAGRHFLVAYPFEGRLAHQTLGMLLTRRLERAGAGPLGFVANDYALAVWGLGDISAFIADGRLSLADLFAEDMLGDDLDAWLAESNLMKRTFRLAAVVAGLIERRHPGKVKSGRQVTMSTDLIYDVLRRHDPDHILLEAAWADAATGLLDIRRLGDFLARVRDRIRHQPLTRVSPLSVPILLEIGREVVSGQARDAILREAADILVEEAMGET